MIEYKFTIDKRCSTNEELPGIIINYSSIKGYQENMMLNEELNNLSEDRGYVRKIVQELEEVKKGKREKIIFGFETTFIDVYKVGYRNELVSFLEGKVFILYDYMTKTLETDLKIDDILKMMTDWRDYIDAWEKKTGKVKK